MTQVQSRSLEMSNQVVIGVGRARSQAVEPLDLGDDQGGGPHQIVARRAEPEAGPGPWPEELGPSVIGVTLDPGQRIGRCCLGQVAWPIAAIPWRYSDLLQPLPVGNNVLDGLAPHASAPPKAWPIARTYNLPLSAERGTKTDFRTIVTSSFGVSVLQ